MDLRDHTQNATPTTSFRLDPANRQDLEEHTKIYGGSKTEVINRAMRFYFNVQKIAYREAIVAALHDNNEQQKEVA